MLEKILLDTDIGTDIDDAVCLAYLLANPQCELLGITTVTGEADKRAMMAEVICNVFGKTIPIYPGYEKPFFIQQKQEKAQQARMLTKNMEKKEFPKNEAINFLKETIRKNSGEIILLTIGPLTNIGMLFKEDPETASLLKGIVLMCGRFQYKNPVIRPKEWNAVGDYHATEIVLNANVKYAKFVGIDITSKVVLEENEFKKIFNHQLLKPVIKFSEIWFKKHRKITFHDPLAAVTIFEKEICKFERGVVNIDIDNERTRGWTFFKKDNNGKHEIAVEVNKNLFFEKYASVFK